MEGVSIKAYKGVRNYLRRRQGYKKLNGTSERRRRRISRLGMGSGSTGRKKRLWRFKIKTKLQIFRMFSPKKFFLWLRDAYVKMMIGIAKSRVCASGYGGAFSGDGVYGFGKGPIKEYDEKMIVEIYKSLVMAQGMVPRDAAKLSSQIVFPRLQAS